MIQTCPDPLVPGTLPGTALLEELSRGATRLGGTKPAEPALLTVPRSSPELSLVPKAVGTDGESRRSRECRVSPPAQPGALGIAPRLGKDESRACGNGLMQARQHCSTAALQHCMHSSAQRAGQARLDGETLPSRWQPLCATGRSCWTLYLIPKKGTVGPMDLQTLIALLKALRKG